jgi:serine/threonine protein kinase
MRARDGSIREVALKRMRPEAVTRRDMRLAFRHEGRLMKHLHHPNIAETYDVGNYRETEFIVMEFVPGPTLQRLIAQCGQTVGSVPTPIALNLAGQICDALDYAHRCCDENGQPLHIVHRDVSPANIILSPNGVVKLIDFGLAKAKMAQTPESNAGTIKGKLNYVAPEYLEGEIDARADLWALGVVLYEMLTGRRLFDAPDPRQTLGRIRTLPIPRPSLGNPRVPPELDAIVLAALERDPNRRWQRADVMGDAIRSVIGLPGNYIDHPEVATWGSWVFTKRMGTEASGLSELATIQGLPPVTAPEPPRPPAYPNAPHTDRTGLVVLIAFSLVTVAMVIWKLLA